MKLSNNTSIKVFGGLFAAMLVLAFISPTAHAQVLDGVTGTLTASTSLSTYDVPVTSGITTNTDSSALLPGTTTSNLNSSVSGTNPFAPYTGSPNIITGVATTSATLSTTTGFYLDVQGSVGTQGDGVLETDLLPNGLSINDASSGIEPNASISFDISNIAVNQKLTIDQNITAPAYFSLTLQGSDGTYFNIYPSIYGNQTFVLNPGVTYEISGSASNRANGNSFTGPVNFVLQSESVPEPSTWALLLGGLGLLAFWRKRNATGLIIARPGLGGACFRSCWHWPLDFLKSPFHARGQWQWLELL